MREIKFRGWDGKTMFEAAQITFNESGWSCDKGRGVSVIFQPHVILMQFTGLQDKNGKECYEKDYDEDGNMIDWCEFCCGYQFFLIDTPTKDVIFCHNCEGNFMAQDHIPDFEIIGNIYENKELLKADDPGSHL